MHIIGVMDIMGIMGIMDWRVGEDACTRQPVNEGEGARTCQPAGEDEGEGKGSHTRT